MFQVNLTIAPNGRVVIPAVMRAELGVQNGGRLVARLIDSTVVLEPIDSAVRRAQALVGRYVSSDVQLVDELIAERHVDAAHE